MANSGLLDGKCEIMAFLNCSENKLLGYKNAGMPVRIEGRRWLAHKDNIEEFFKEHTNPKIKRSHQKKPVK